MELNIDSMSIQKNKLSDDVLKFVTQLKLDNNNEPTFVTKRIEHYMKTVEITELSCSGAKEKFNGDGEQVKPIKGSKEVYYTHKIEYNDKGINGIFLFNI